MLVVYLNRARFEPREIANENKELLKEAVWIDLISPSKEEEKLVQEVLHIELPSRDEMAEIQISSRLYKDQNTLFMTASMLAHADSLDPKFDPITFALTNTQLITIRYIEPQAFRLFTARISKLEQTHRDALTLLLELLEASIERLADVLELIGRRLEAYSKVIFKTDENNSLEKKAEKIDSQSFSAVRETNTGNLDYKTIMQQIGLNGNLLTKAQESLTGLNRLATFLAQMGGDKIAGDPHSRLTTLSRDISSLNDQAHFTSSKINFLLDATLGMLNIEQNNIIKIFSVAAVIFLPPTLIASIYGMNFHFIPELSWSYGYLYSLGMMAFAAYLPYKYFKHRKWL